MLNEEVLKTGNAALVALSNPKKLLAPGSAGRKQV
jgi:hypothetical protein